MTVDLDPAKLEELLSMWEQGLRAEEIAKELELPITRVRKELRAHGRKKGSVASRADEADICTEYQADLPIADLLSRHSITYTMLYTILARNGVPIRKVAQQQGREAQMQVAIDMYSAGLPIWQITRDTGVQQPTLHSELHTRGIPLRRPRRIHEQPQRA